MAKQWIKLYKEQLHSHTMTELRAEYRADIVLFYYELIFFLDEKSDLKIDDFKQFAKLYRHHFKLSFKKIQLFLEVFSEKNLIIWEKSEIKITEYEDIYISNNAKRQQRYRHKTKENKPVTRNVTRSSLYTTNSCIKEQDIEKEKESNIYNINNKEQDICQNDDKKNISLSQKNELYLKQNDGINEIDNKPTENNRQPAETYKNDSDLNDLNRYLKPYMDNLKKIFANYYKRCRSPSPTDKEINQYWIIGGYNMFLSKYKQLDQTGAYQNSSQIIRELKNAIDWTFNNSQDKQARFLYDIVMSSNNPFETLIKNFNRYISNRPPIRKTKNEIKLDGYVTLISNCIKENRKDLLDMEKQDKTFNKDIFNQALQKLNLTEVTLNEQLTGL